MALTPEQLAEIQRLKALMQPLATEAQRKAQAIWNAEQIANRNQPPGKADGGNVDMDQMLYALLCQPKHKADGGITHAHHLEIEEIPL